MVPSPRVPTYDLQPEMNAEGVANAVSSAHLTTLHVDHSIVHDIFLPRMSKIVFTRMLCVYM